MSGGVLLLLVLLVLGLPTIGAAILRLIAPRLTERVGLAIAASLFGLTLLAALGLALSGGDTLRIGDLSLLAPASAVGR